MAKSAKVAVSVDAKLLARVEALRQASGESRSGIVSRALRLLSGETELESRRREYVRAYREHPESEAEVSAARVLAERALRGLPWDDK